MQPNKKTLWLAILLALLGSAILAACGPAATATQTATEKPTEVAETEQPTEEATSEASAYCAALESTVPAKSGASAVAGNKVLKMNFVQEPDNLNPLYSSMYFSSILHQIWNAWAWDFDENNAPRPVLVKAIPSVDNGGVSEDGTVITMCLRDDIAWSDGEPITSDDFVFTWEMRTAEANTVDSRDPYDRITSVEAPDKTTVVVTFGETYVPWLTALWHGVLPAHVLRPVFEADGTLDNAEWNFAPTVGAGPFVFAEWETGNFMRFVRNDNYYNDPAVLDEVFISFITDNSAQQNAVIAGDSDVGSFLDFSEAPDYQASGVTIAISRSGYNDGLFFRIDDLGHPALADVKVRQAIALGIDRFSINQELLGGVTTPPATFWEGTPYTDPALAPWPYDPERAKALLDEAGWVDSNGDGTRDKDGVELVLTYGTNQREVRKQIQAIVQEQLGEIGIGIDLVNYESDTFFGAFADGGPMAVGDLDIMEYSDTTDFPDPNTVYFICDEIPTAEYSDGTNYQGLCDKDLDALFAAQASEIDSAKRTEMFHEITRIMYENVYWLGLFPDPDLWAVGPRVQNAKFSGVTPFFNIAEWDLSE